MLTVPKYRIFWTWDFATCWDHSFFGREKGCSGQNGRRVNFLRDYKRLIDFASAHHINGVVIWGAVRAHNNGMEQLKELVRYGRQHGVRVLPGVSAFSYGGVCYDPREDFNGYNDVPMTSHPYSLYTWLRQHPEYAAVGPDGKPYPQGPYHITACPSRKENIEWFKSGLQWLYEEFDVDGIQVEVGDYSVCHCPLCTARRKQAQQSAKSSDYFAVADMVACYNAAIEVSLRMKPDAWVICETYSNIADIPSPGSAPDKIMPQSSRVLLRQLYQGGILQWSVDRGIGGYKVADWSKKVYTPSSDNILRIHAGSQWSMNGPDDWGVNLVWEMVRRAREQGINGVSIFGEESPSSPPNEANYLAFEEACGLGKPNPECSEELFYAQTLDPLYGGQGLASRWRELYLKGSMLCLGDAMTESVCAYNDRQHVNSNQPFELLTDDPHIREKALTYSPAEKVKELEAYYAEARSISASLSSDARGRWSWLENKLWNMRYIISTQV